VPHTVLSAEVVPHLYPSDVSCLVFCSPSKTGRRGSQSYVPPEVIPLSAAERQRSKGGFPLLAANS